MNRNNDSYYVNIKLQRIVATPEHNLIVFPSYVHTWESDNGLKRLCKTGESAMASGNTGGQHGR